MYAVFSACGKQYKVKKGDTLRLELLTETLGQVKNFTDVLLVGEGANLKIGKPLVANAAVKAEILGIEKGPKIEIMHRKRRKAFKRHVGHRQPHTRVLITEINNGSTVDALSKDERNSIIKRVGFVMRDAFAPVALDDSAKVKYEEKLKMKADRQKARLEKARTAPANPAAKKAKAKSAKTKTAGKKASSPKAKKTTTTKKTAKKDE